MSRVGKQILSIPQGVEVHVDNGVYTVKGPKGTLRRTFRDDVTITIDGTTVTFAPRRNDSQSKALWGTYASEMKAMLTGVVTPFQKKLMVEGVGYKWDVKGKELHLALGFSHPVVMEIPEGLTIVADKGTLTISGCDKEQVGLFANRVRAKKKPEPYKGKGIRYSDETILRKQGKKTA